jgi:hypothetical protein
MGGDPFHNLGYQSILVLLYHALVYSKAWRFTGCEDKAMLDGWLGGEGELLNQSELRIPRR